MVSAIITTYKRPIEILQRAIDSAINQTYQNIEIIVVNDNPDEAVLDNQIRTMIQNKGIGRIRYIVHTKNYGACRARNTGILAARGEFIAFLDDDDEWLPEKTQMQLSAFTSEKIGMVTGPYYDITELLPDVVINKRTQSENLFRELLRANILGGSSIPMMRCKVFDICGMFDEKLLSSQDYDMWLRIAQKYEIKCLSVPLVRKYMREDSITKNFEKQKNGFYTFIEKHKLLYENDRSAYNFLINKNVNNWIGCGQFRDAWKLYCMALKAKPLSVYNIGEPMKGILKYFANYSSWLSISIRNYRIRKYKRSI